MKLWTREEDAVLVERYEAEGPWRIAADIGRTAHQVRCRAYRMGLRYDTPEPAVVTPAHDYTDDDRAWQSARLPVFNRGLLTWRLVA